MKTVRELHIEIEDFKKQLEISQVNEFKSIFNNIDIGIALHKMIFDEKGNPIDFVFLDVNAVYEQMTQLKASDIIGKRGLDTISNQIQKWIDLYRKVSKTGDSISIIDHSEYFDKWWEVKAFSPGKNLFAVVLVDITDRKMAEKKLKDQNLRYSTLLKNINGLVYRCENDPDWTMSYVSNGSLDLTGYKPKHFINNDTITYNDLILPKHQEYVWKTIQHRVSKNEEYEIEYQIQTASGEIKWVWERGCGIFDDDNNFTHLEGIISDITERKRAEEESKKLSKAIEQSPETVIITDKFGTIEYVNPTFEKLTGYSSIEAIGQNPHLLKSNHHDQDYYKTLWATILNGNTWYGEFLNKKKNGELYWERASISPIINEKNETTHFVAVKEDITNDKQLLADLQMAKEKAEESDRLKSAFLLNISHEMRTPMNSILGFTELLTQPGLSGEVQQKYLSKVKGSCRRLLNTVTDLIEISKVETHQLDLYTEKIHLATEVNNIIDEFKSEIAKKGLEITYSNRIPATHPDIFNDKSKLIYIITNLIKNAAKYTLTGIIQIVTEKENNQIVFWVKDTGIGIPTQRLKAIFKHFEQADIEDSQAMQGSGLGLAISKAYIELMGGKIWVESEAQKGSTFYITIPDMGKETKTQITKIMENPHEPSPDKQLKILIAEDDKTSEMHLSIVIRDMAREIIYATSGSETIELCRQNPDIDLILMDIKMPVMDGYKATQEIKKFNKKVIIIAQTAYALSGDREKALEAGCDDYISKPIKVDEFKQKISKCLVKQ